MPHDAALYATGVKSKSPAATLEDFETSIEDAQDEYQSSADASLAQFQGRVDYEEPASITSIDPTEFEAQPADTTVTLDLIGNGFTGVTSVRLQAVPATTFTIVDDNNITAVFPRPVAAGLLGVVTVKGGVFSNPPAVLDFTIAP